MRAVSSAVSLTAHVAIGAAVVLSTVDARPHRADRPRQITVVIQPRVVERSLQGLSGGPIVPETVVLPVIPIPLINTPPHGVPPPRPAFPVQGTGASALPSPPGAPGDVWEAPFVEEAPQILAGPLPAYPELLRQAGIRGRVVLEAVVDTAGRVERGSLTVVSATNPGFVAPARQALAATLFRPGRVHGRAVRVRVRIPVDFTLRSGTGPAR